MKYSQHVLIHYLALPLLPLLQITPFQWPLVKPMKWQKLLFLSALDLEHQRPLWKRQRRKASILALSPPIRLMPQSSYQFISRILFWWTTVQGLFLAVQHMTKETLISPTHMTCRYYRLFYQMVKMLKSLLSPILLIQAMALCLTLVIGMALILTLVKKLRLNLLCWLVREQEKQPIDFAIGGFQGNDIGAVQSQSSIAKFVVLSLS